MTEVEIRQAVAQLVNAYKAADKLRYAEVPNNKAVAEQQEACEAIAIELASQVLVDLNRAANALESLADTQHRILERQIHV